MYVPVGQYIVVDNNFVKVTHEDKKEILPIYNYMGTERPILNTPSIIHSNKFSPESYLIGMYWGDGCMHGNNCLINLGANEWNICEIIVKRAINLGMKSTIKCTDSTIDINIIGFKKWMEHIAGVTTKEHVPNFILSIDNIPSFFGGIYDADGATGYPTFTSKNTEFVRDIAMILNGYGIYTSHYVYSKEFDRTQITNHLYIRNLDRNLLFATGSVKLNKMYIPKILHKTEKIGQATFGIGRVTGDYI